jgi:hypothetical protein
VVSAVSRPAIRFRLPWAGAAYPSSWASCLFPSRLEVTL